MYKFKSSDYNRQKFKIKDIRNDIMGILEENRAWEIVVGPVISKLQWSDGSTSFAEDGNILNYLGKKTVENILLSLKVN